LIYKKEHGSFDELERELQIWYLHDKGSLPKEIMELMLDLDQ
jgi:hypothetical protein